MAEKPRSALVIVAHPDDAEFLCAGTIAKWCAEGWEVNYVLATRGDAGSHDLKTTSEKLAAMREREQRAACNVLGVKDCVFLDYKDGFVEDDAEFRGELVRQIRRFKPEVVLTWDPNRRTHNHRDHRNTGQAAIDAVYPLSRSHLSYPEHLKEGLEPHRVKEALLAGSDQPNYYVDVTAYFDKKMEAVACHKSQVGRRRSREMRARVRERLASVGRNVGFELAEAFYRITW